MSKFVSFAKYTSFPFLMLVALIISWALGSLTIVLTIPFIGVWGGVAAASLIVGLVFFGFLKLLHKILGNLSLLNHEALITIFAVTTFAAAAIAIFVIPIDTPMIETYNVPHETITLSKGEQIALYHFQPEKKISETPILFVPGGPGGPVVVSAMEFLKQFAAQGFEVYAYDHYSSGNSSLNTFDPSLLTIDDEVRRVHEILNRIGTPQAYVIGHSYAGVLLGRVDALYPEQIAKLVLLDTSPLYDFHNGNLKSAATLDPELAKMLRGAEVTPVINRSPSLLADLSLRENIRGFLMMLLRKDGVPIFGKNEEVSFFVEKFIGEAITGEKITADSPRTFAGLSFVANVLIGDSIAQSPDYSQTLIAANTSPVLVVHPEHGAPWPIHKDYENFFDNVFFLPLANAEHRVWEKPENATLLINVISDFLLDQADSSLFYTDYGDPFKK